MWPDGCYIVQIIRQVETESLWLHNQVYISRNLPVDLLARVSQSFHELLCYLCQFLLLLFLNIVETRKKRWRQLTLYPLTFCSRALCRLRTCISIVLVWALSTANFDEISFWADSLDKFNLCRRKTERPATLTCKGGKQRHPIPARLGKALWHYTTCSTVTCMKVCMHLNWTYPSCLTRQSSLNFVRSCIASLLLLLREAKPLYKYHKARVVTEQRILYTTPSYATG